MKQIFAVLLALSLMLCACSGNPNTAGTENSIDDGTPDNDTASPIYYTGEAGLWQIGPDGETMLLSREQGSVCVDGHVYELYANRSRNGTAQENRTWGVRADGETIYEAPLEYDENDPFELPLKDPMTMAKAVQFGGDHVYFMTALWQQREARLCRVGLDGTFEMYDFPVSPNLLLCNGELLYFCVSGDSGGLPACMDLTSGEVRTLSDVPNNGLGPWLDRGTLWWEYSAEDEAALYSSNGDKFPIDSDCVVCVGGGNILYTRGNTLYAVDTISGAQATYSVFPGSIAVGAADWGALLAHTEAEENLYYLLPYDTGELTPLKLE